MLQRIRRSLAPPAAASSREKGEANAYARDVDLCVVIVEACTVSQQCSERFKRLESGMEGGLARCAGAFKAIDAHASIGARLAQSCFF